MEQLGHRTKLEGLLLTTEKTFFEFGKLLPEKEQSSIRGSIEHAKKALNSDETVRINECLTELKVASNILSEAILSGS